MFAKMDDDDIRELSQAMANLGVMNASAVEQVLIEFASQIGTGALRGSFETIERALLAGGLDSERVEYLMEEMRGPAGRTLWDKLGNVNEETLATYLKNEYPQTVAVVLSKLLPDNAARVLGALPEDLAMEVVTRMLGMEPVRKEVLESVEQTLRKEFMSNLARSTQRDSHEMMADIFSNFDRATETRFLTSLEDSDKDSAERIKGWEVSGAAASP